MLSNVMFVKAGFHFSDQIPAFSDFIALTVPLKGKIGSTGSRNFVLSNKLETQNLEDSMMTTTTTRKTSGRWKAWLNKSFGLMVPSH
ncbi:unnamed protein product [Arabidopsis thaliana]|uniref:Uncharacterized protein n=1 Tax=Arabidopsis thaliana TaxID=3702 RepID=A0A654ER27_ARATH|nr:unnamed protein product [Arabidopsis thaliana]VYS51733.1 unnamed protein product [Arabidopsis thaliana]